MAKKRLNKAQARKWPEEDVATLLAWLDYTLRHPQIKFRATILDRLDDTYTLEKVERKLKAVWELKGPNEVPLGTKALEHIYAHGSKALDNDGHGLSETEKEKIANVLDQFEQAFLSTDHVATNNRRLRSASRFSSKGPDASASPRTVYNEHEERNGQQQPTSTPLYKNGTESSPVIKALPSSSARGVKRKRTLSKKDVYNQPSLVTPNGRIGTQERLLPATPTICHMPQSREQCNVRYTRSTATIYDSEESPSDEVYEDLNNEAQLKKRLQQSTVVKAPRTPQTQWQLQVKHDESGEIIRCICGSKEEPEEGEVGWISCCECKVWQHTKCVKYLCDECQPPPASIRSLRNSSTQTSWPLAEIENSDERLKGAIAEIEVLKRLMVEKGAEMLVQENQVGRLERKISAMEGARKRRDEDYGTPVEAEIRMLLEERDRLQRELGDRTELGTFTKLSTNQQSHHVIGDIVSFLNKMYVHRDESLGGMGDRNISTPLQLEQYPDLRSLVDSAIGASAEIDSTPIQVNIVDDLLKGPSQAVLKALMTSAIRDWVFYNDFPCFDGDKSQTLQVYRENIAKLGTRMKRSYVAHFAGLTFLVDGPTALRNLDLATMESLITEPTFQERTIPERSTILANRLSVALAPLFQQVPRLPVQLTWDGFATWQSNPDDVKERRHHLIEMFANALRAKAKSCLNVEWYEMVVYSPSTRFDPKTMVAQTVDGMRDPVQHYKNREVRICVEAALFAYPREELSDRDNISDCTMSARNFRTQQHREFEPLMKAVVVL
ncbi:hypothetical protein EG329_013869 [Mollisiaceae sp. DMI_Dod_QoI]|nr:hypothetical protein EG329_013869 [Helotiales sp. DMI_Dod_QoI]